MENLKLYLLTWDRSDNYEVYTHALVAALNVDDAKRIRPDKLLFDEKGYHLSELNHEIVDIKWPCHVDDVLVQYLGNAAPHIDRGLIHTHYTNG